MSAQPTRRRCDGSMNGKLRRRSIEHLLRELAPQVLGVVARRFRDFASRKMRAGSDAGGLPAVAAGGGSRESARLADSGGIEADGGYGAQRNRAPPAGDRDDRGGEPGWSRWKIEAEMDPEDTLILLFMCCHSALSSVLGDRADAAGGGRADHGGDCQCISGSRADDGAADQPCQASHQGLGRSLSHANSAERGERLPAVLHVLYLIFSEGYASSIGAQLQRLDLAREAIRLTRSARALLPEDAEVAGLLALMLLTDARRAARTGAGWRTHPVGQTGPGLWDRAEITEGTDLLTLALSKGAVGLYQLQAAIAAVHDEAATRKIRTGRRFWRCTSCFGARRPVPW